MDDVLTITVVVEAPHGSETHITLPITHAQVRELDRTGSVVLWAKEGER